MARALQSTTTLPSAPSQPVHGHASVSGSPQTTHSTVVAQAPDALWQTMPEGHDSPAASQRTQASGQLTLSTASDAQIRGSGQRSGLS